jgi:ribosomal protein L29
MEWHASAITEEQRDKAIAELKGTLAKLRKSKAAP